MLARSCGQAVVVDEDVVAHAHLGDGDLGTKPGTSAGVLEVEPDCRRSGNGGPQTCLPAAHGVALLVGPYGPYSPTSIQDPREGPSLVRRTTQDLLRSGLARQVREGRRDQGKTNLARFR